MAAELRKLGATVVEGADFIEVTPPRRAGRRRGDLRTYDDHRMAMCLSLAAFNPLGRWPAVPVRILDPRCVAKTFPDYFETLFDVAAADPATIPVITIDGPTASGKGTLAARGGRAPGLPPARFGRAVPRHRAGGAARRRARPTTPPALARAGRARCPALRGPSARLARRRGRHRRLRHEAVGALASRVSALARRAPGPARACSCRSAALPGLVADGRDMGTVVFPDAAAQGVPHRERRQRAERRHKQLISKGISANIDRPSRRPRGARRARQQSRRLRL